MTNHLNQIINASSENMQAIPCNSIHHVFTSPPYNVGIEYGPHDDKMSIDDYLQFLTKIFAECKRVMVDNAKICINVANTGRSPYIPLTSHINLIMINLGFFMKGEIIWSKGPSARKSTAWGSWQSSSNPCLRDVHEYILVFSNGNGSLSSQSDQRDTMTRDSFLRDTESIWHVLTESKSKWRHPAPFPVELPKRSIELFTKTEHTVLDPFMGSGTTAIAAIQTGRHFVGYELNPEYAETARARIYREQRLNTPSFSNSHVAPSITMPASKPVDGFNQLALFA